ncbi:MAG: phosphotransferase [Streptosporangiales bacterium]
MNIGATAAVAAHLRDPLRRNADALILGTGITSALGLAFWALAARWLSTETVGIGAALVSTVTLLANLATLGLRNGLVRFLPLSGVATRRLILSSYAVCAVAAVLAAGIFLLGQPLWAGRLGFLRANPTSVIAFIVATAFWVIFVLQDQVLIGLRRSVWVPVENTFASVLKIAVLPLVATAAAWSIFTATVIPTALAVIFITALILRFAGQAASRDQRPVAETRVPVSQLIRFAASDHAAGLLWMCTADVLTLIVLHQSGAEASAYYYMANTIGYSLYLVTSNVGSALIAESAHDPGRSITHARQALLHSARMVIPLAAVGILCAPLVLDVLGRDYARNAAPALQLILASAVPQLIVGISVSTARVRREMRTVVGVYAFTAFATWGGSWFALGWWGVTGVGVAVLVNQCLVAAFLLATGRTGLWPDRNGWRDLARGVEQLPLMLRRRRSRRELKRRLAPALDACGLAPRRAPSMLTSDSDTVVVALPEPPEPVVLKIATSAAAASGLDRHAETVTRLHAQLAPELAILLPRVLRRAVVDGNPVLAETRLPGTVASELEPTAGTTAIEAMRSIHAATARQQTADEQLLTSWIDEPSQALRRVGRAYGLVADAANVDRLAEALRQDWLGQELTVSCVHGDFWPGNVLVDIDSSRVSGIVDWENGSAIGLPDADLVHWWLSAQPTELGAAVRDVLRDPRRVQDGLADLGITLPNPQLRIEHVVLLAWLGHVSATITRASRNRLGLVWLTRNVRPVTRLFGAQGERLPVGAPQ